MCTNEETNVTTQHIMDVKLSNIKPQSTLKTPESIQVVSLRYTGLPERATSKKMRLEIVKVVHKHTTVTIEDPVGPSTRPNIPAEKDPINGKKITSKYILVVL